MAITPLETLEVIETMENFIAKIRPPKSIRKKLDINLISMTKANLAHNSFYC
jgi:hypothetical protein